MNTCVEGRKRQLPSWMMPKVGACHESNSANIAETKTNVSVENGDISVADVRKIDRKKETSKRKLNSKEKCEVKGETNLDQQNESGDDITEKKRKRANKSKDKAPRRSIKKRGNLEDRSCGSGDDVCPVQVSSDDDVELTVEDLMAIAEQYVKDYEDKEQRETTGRHSEPKWQFLATAEAGITLYSPCENEKPSCSVREDLYNSSPAATGEVIPTSTSQIGHPAQDMLDVFLGPLLRNL